MTLLGGRPRGRGTEGWGRVAAGVREVLIKCQEEAKNEGHVLISDYFRTRDLTEKSGGKTLQGNHRRRITSVADPTRSLPRTLT